MVKLVCYNIEYCEGIAGRWYQYLYFWRTFFQPKELDRQIVDAIGRMKPDIVALVEVDTGSFRSKRNEVVFFKNRLGMRSFVKKVRYHFYGWMNLFRYVPVLNKRSNAIMSKYALKGIRYHWLHEGIKRVVIEATVRCPKKVTLLLAHLAVGKRTRALQIGELVGIVNSIKNPVILMGDFNTFGGDGEIRKLLEETHLKDYARMSEKSIGLTWPTWHPIMRPDYVLVSPQIKVKRYDVLKYGFSDHMPLFVEFIVK